jgi:predicted DNA-binding protein with PD1-like motif
MEQDEPPFLRPDVVIDPDLFRRDEIVDLVVAAFREIDEQDVADEFAVDDPVELVGLLGNVSRRDGATAVHAHATLARHDGGCVGGHVAPGCVVFACELILQELVGEPLERAHDDVTGLPLWRGL